MAKYPAPGRVKTRLAAALGEAVAVALGRAFVVDLAVRLRAAPFAVTWAYWPPDAPFATLVPDARIRGQEGADLGARMAAAIASELDDGARTVLVVGADVPHVDLAVLGEARDALRAGGDVVLGPALDGGYYLIGVRAPQPALFGTIAWGTSTVLAATRERAAAAGLRVHLLPETFDVDGPTDLARLRTLIDAGIVRLPATAAVLATLGEMS
jgi:uncharacterized protein